MCFYLVGVYGTSGKGSGGSGGFPRLLVPLLLLPRSLKDFRYDEIRFQIR